MPKEYSRSASLTAENTFCDAISVDKNDIASISISGTFVGTITLQRMLDQANWRDVTTWVDAGAEMTYDGDEGGEIRLGFKTGEYTSGTAVVRLGV